MYLVRSVTAERLSEKDIRMTLEHFSRPAVENEEDQAGLVKLCESGFEREHGVVHVVVDAPAGVTNRTQTVWSFTNPRLAVVRLHGRNVETWNASGPSSAARFNYDYSDDELRELAHPIRELAAQATDAHVVFNNCYEDYAARNARSLMRMIGA